MEDFAHLLSRLGVRPPRASTLAVHTPIDGSELARVAEHSADDVSAAIGRAYDAFLEWRSVPAPKRGQLIRSFGDVLRANKEDLGLLVTCETGKIIEEGLGEVQEMIDICDFAAGLSRQLHGLTMPSERDGHAMRETWHPLGVAGIITAFNFPAAVWAWNAALALVCGDTCIWKPSEKTPLTALAAQALFNKAALTFPGIPGCLSQVVTGQSAAGAAIVDDARISLVSATGSTRMGREIAPRIASRLSRSILELGGNNGIIVTPSADLNLAIDAIVFAAIGTAGQRCTSLRRLIVHESLHCTLVERLKSVYDQVTIGDPRDRTSMMGPLISKAAFESMERALAEAEAAGGRIHGGGRILAERWPATYYVRPALVEMPEQAAVVRRETFAPILYILKYRDLDEAIAIHNAVPQGLASSIFTTDLREAEAFLSAAGSDCGIVNVNIGPSGAEIGGAFGGEKETGGGREAGSDSWKAYMRRATNTINYSSKMPLAQGIQFGIKA